MTTIAAISRNRLLEVLARHVGKDKGVHAIDLVKEMLVFQVPVADLPRHERRVRELIEELRNEGSHICATPGDGYYMASNDEELNATLEFLYSRAMSSLKKIAAMKRVSVPDLRGQLHLPT